MKEYKTKHGGYKIETIESSDGTVDVHVGQQGFLKTTWASPSTKTFDNHTQAVSHAKKANVWAGYWGIYWSGFGREKAAASSTNTVKTTIIEIVWKLQKLSLSQITGHHQNTR